MVDFTRRRITMVDTQVRPSDVTRFPIIEAMLTIPRELFVPADKRDMAYVGEHVSIGDGRVVLDPRVLAKMLDACDVQPTDLVLDIGAGLGYGAAVLARLAEAVIAVEQDADTISEAEAALAEAGIDNVALVEGPLTEGATKHGPYDVIFVEGAVSAFPDTLAKQLKAGGRVVAIFEEGQLGVVRVGYNEDGHISWRYAFNGSAPVLPGFERDREFVF